MISSAVVSLFFLAGVFLQSFLFVPTLFSDTKKRKNELILLVLIAIIVPVSYIINLLKNKYVLSIEVVIIEFVFLYSVLFIGIFREDILPYINESIILQLTIISCYFALTSRLPTILIYPLFFIVPYVVFLNFSSYELGNIPKFLLYVWYLLMSAVILGILMYARLTRLYQLPVFSILDAFLGGMISLRLFTPIYFLLQLIPFPSKQTSFSDRIYEVKIEIEQMIQHYINFQVRITATLLTVLLQTAILALNYWLNILPEWSVIDGSIILFAIFLQSYYGTTTAK